VAWTPQTNDGAGTIDCSNAIGQRRAWAHIGVEVSVVPIQAHPSDDLALVTTHDSIDEIPTHVSLG
jgi:hypothetical protein